METGYLVALSKANEIPRCNMNRLEHANLVVKDIQASLDFLLAAFPLWRVRGEGQGRWADRARNWLHVGDDDYYLTLNDGAEGEIRDLGGIAPGLAHLGFVVDDMDNLIQRLTSKGYEIDIVGRNHPHRKTVYFIDPNGFQFEFIQYLSSDAVLKNQYGGESGELVRSEKFNIQEFVEELYRQVDSKNTEYLDEVLGDNVRFCIGNNPIISDKNEVLIANQNFFNSIASMTHSITNIIIDGTQVSCHGRVDYVRLDGSDFSAVFSTALKIDNNKITEYLVFADLSGL